jgi:hypothetical protein
MLVFCKEGQKDRAVDVKEVQIVKKKARIEEHHASEQELRVAARGQPPAVWSSRANQFLEQSQEKYCTITTSINARHCTCFAYSCVLISRLS